jgi:hypothetical protein
MIHEGKFVLLCTGSWSHVKRTSSSGVEFGR